MVYSKSSIGYTKGQKKKKKKKGKRVQTYYISKHFSCNSGIWFNCKTSILIVDYSLELVVNPHDVFYFNSQIVCFTTILFVVLFGER